MSLVRHYRELDVYQNAMNLAMNVFEQTIRMANQPEKWLIKPRKGGNDA